MKNAFIHHVFFWLGDPNSAAGLAKLHAGLKTLSRIKTIRQFHNGRSAATARAVIENSYSLCWLVVFGNDDDQASYQIDPIPLQFVHE